MSKHDGTRYCTIGVTLLALLAGGQALAQETPPATGVEDTTGTSTAPAEAAPADAPPPAPPAPPPAPPAPPPAPAAPVDNVPADDTLDGMDPSELEVSLDGEGQSAEVIVMTGSRIRTDALDKTAPVLQLTRDEIDRTGLTSVADLLQHLPVSGGALNTRFNSSGNFGFPPDGGGVGAGSAQADLRNLGAKRVLVLVDGVRWVNESSASGVSSATDLNTIPIGIIERIEVLEDGASPIYGSDAIGGVINIITRKNWEGVVANAYTGGFHQGDGLTQQYDVSWGMKNQRTSMGFSMSFVDQGQVSSADRAISRFPIPGVQECTFHCSSGTPAGRVVFTDPNTGGRVNITLGQNVTGGAGYVPTYDPSNPGGGNDSFKVFEDRDRFNFAPYNLMVTPSQRMGMFGNLEHKLLPRVSLFGRALFSTRSSVNQAAPEPLFFGPVGASGNRLENAVIHVDNPYNPFGFSLDPSLDYLVGRRPVEAGPRIFEQSVNTWYTAGGLQGDFDVNETRFYWDTTAAFAINRADQIKHGSFNAAKILHAVGPGYMDSNGTLRCGTPDSPGPADCVPLNLFGGPGSFTPEMLDYITYVQKEVSEQQLFDLTANISGNIVRLPAGFLSFAAGVEHRRQSGFYQPDAVVVAGDGAGVPSSPTAGKFHASEGYGEVRLPLAAKQPGADLLDLSGAVRLSNYSTFGTQSTFKVGARWRPIKDVMFRGTYGQGFRAPGIGELFGAEARFDQSLNDPCSDMLGRGEGRQAAPPEIIANCVALGVPEDGTYEQANPQIGVRTGGNRNLLPEKSDSVTASLVYSPSWLTERSPWIDNLDLELTYYWIELDGAIQALDAQVQLDTCVRTLDPTLCSGIGRTNSGVINSFANQLTNIGGLRTDGIDVTVSYLTPATELGRLRVTSISSFLNNFTEIIPTSMGFQEIEREGTEVGDPERGFPRLKSSLILDWYRREWRASLTTRYIHSLMEQCRNLGPYSSLCSAPNMADDSQSANKLRPMVYNDVQVSWTPPALDNLFDLTIGINNLFNQSPPRCFSCALNGFDASTYDVPGMFGYLKAGYRMW